jgi:diguanylate cyclase
VLDSEREPLFDRLVRMASAACGAPIALVSLVDAERQWFKAETGLPGVSETPREVAFCAHAIAGDALFEVPDAMADPRFASNPLVTGQPDIRFYAGVPLVLHGMVSGEAWDLELPLVTATGRALWVRAVGEVEFETGQPVRLVGAFQDITERKHLQLQLAASERFVRVVTDNLPVRIAYVDAERRFRFVNQAQCERFGLAREQIIGRTRAEMLARDDDAVEARVRAVMAGTPQRYEHEESTPTGRRVIEARLIPDATAAGVVQGFFSTGTDITQLKEHQEQVEHIAFHDALTGLPNRLLLADRMRQALMLDERQQRSLAVCYLDLDGFKAVNDAHGHDAGDALLQEVARRLLRCVRSSDTVSRLGGDEFVLLLTPLGQTDECQAVLKRVITALQEPLMLPAGCPAMISASIGVSFFPDHGNQASQLMALADEAMYAVKRSGKNRVAFHMPG